MIIQNEAPGLEINVSQVRSIFPNDYISVMWECDADDIYCNLSDTPDYQYTGWKCSAYYFDEYNKEIDFDIAIDQKSWIIPFMETDAERVLLTKLNKN